MVKETFCVKGLLYLEVAPQPLSQARLSSRRLLQGRSCIQSRFRAQRFVLKLMTLVLTSGQQHKATAFEPLMERGEVKRQGRSRPKLRPHRVVGDKAYSSRKIQQYARRRGLCITIPRKRNECRTGPFDWTVYRTRNRTERLINRLKQFRRLASRYEKRTENYRAMWIVAATLLWL